MQSRLYHYEIDHAVVNAIYAARNTNDGSAVTIYEWTPPIADRAAAKLRLAELPPEVKNKLAAQVFTSDASLYLTAATPDQANAALAVLQPHKLFLGLQISSSKQLVPPAELAPRSPEPTGDIVADYNTARSMGNEGADWFKASFGWFGLSCTNLSEFMLNPSIILIFSNEPRGSLLGVRHRRETWLVPALDMELEALAPFIRGVFDIPQQMSGRLVLSSAAVIEQSGDLWQLKARGAIRPGSSPSPASGETREEQLAILRNQEAKHQRSRVETASSSSEEDIWPAIAVAVVVAVAIVLLGLLTAAIASQIRH